MSMIPQTNVNVPTTGSLPNAKLLQKIGEWFQDAEMNRREAERKWLEALAVLDGYHYYKYNSVERQLKILSNPPEGHIFARTDQPLSRFQSQIARLCATPITIDAQAKSGNSGERVLQAMINKRLIEYEIGIERMDMEYQRLLLAEYITICGTGALQWGWDSVAEQPYTVAIPAWSLYPFPALAMKDTELGGVIKAEFKDKDWVKEHLPGVDVGKSGGLTDVRSSPLSGYGAYQGRGFTPNMTRGVFVKEVFIKRCKDFKNGAYVVVVNNEIAKPVADLPAFPFEFFRHLVMPHYWWGKSFMDPIIPISKEMNRVLSNEISKNIWASNMGLLLLPMTYGIDMQQLKQRRGGVIQYEPEEFGDLHHEPHHFPPPKMDSASHSLFAMLRQELDDLTFQHEVSRGDAPGRVDSFQAVRQLLQQDIQPGSPIWEGLRRGITRAVLGVRELMRENYPEEQLLKLSESDPLLQRFIVASRRSQGEEESSIDILGNIEALNIEVSSLVPASIGAQLEELRFRVQGQLISPSDYVEGVKALGLKVPSIDSNDTPHIRKAELENAIMFGDGENPGELPMLLPWTEDHELHLKSHKQFGGTPEFAMASDEVHTKHKEHMEYHFSNSNVMGSVTDADDDEITESIFRNSVAGEQEAMAAEMHGTEYAQGPEGVEG